MAEGSATTGRRDSIRDRRINPGAEPASAAAVQTSRASASRYSVVLFGAFRALDSGFRRNDEGERNASTRRRHSPLRCLSTCHAREGGHPVAPGLVGTKSPRKERSPDGGRRGFFRRCPRGLAMAGGHHHEDWHSTFRCAQDAQFVPCDALECATASLLEGMLGALSTLVTPAEAGVQFFVARSARWIPAFAGMTGCSLVAKSLRCVVAALLEREDSLRRYR